MERWRSSSNRQYRLLLRVYGAENLKHVSSQGTLCKITLEEGAMTRGSARASLKRLLHKTDPSGEFRVYKTQAQKSPCGKPVWNEKFEIPIFDPAHESINIRVRSARLMSAPAIGEVTLLLRDVSTDSTVDRWVNLLDNSKRPVGRLRIQMRLDTTSPLSRSVDEDELRDQYLPRRTSTHSSRSMPSPVPKPSRRSTIVAPPIGGAGVVRRSSGLSRSLLDSHASGSGSANESISSDNSNDRDSVPVAPSTYSENPFQDSIMSSPLISRSSKSSRDTFNSIPAAPPSYSENPFQDSIMSSPLLSRSSKSSSMPRDTGMDSQMRFTGSRVTGMSAMDRFTGLSRPTGLSLASRATEELDFLASKYMARPTQASATAASNQIEPHQEKKEGQLELDDLLPARERSTSNRPLAQCELDTSEQMQSVQPPASPTSPSSTPTPFSGSSALSASSPVSSTTPTSLSPTGSPSSLASPEAKSSSKQGSSSDKAAKDERSPRTTNTTATSSDEETPVDTVEFDFDTCDVRPSTRLPSHMMRSTVSRSSVATSRIESDDEDCDSDDREDDEMDPDGDPDGPRMFLRATVANLLGRDSVNVIMDADEEDEDYDDFETDPFVFDEFPILDMGGTLLLVHDFDRLSRSSAS